MQKLKLLRNLTLLAAILGLLPAASVATAETIWFHDDFETDTVGTDPAIQTGDIGDSYIITDPSPAGDYVDVWDDTASGLTGSDGQYTSIKRDGTYHATFYAVMTGAPEDDLVTIEFDMYHPANRQLSLFGCNGPDADPYNQRTFVASFYDNKIKLYGGSGFYPSGGSDYPTEQWTHVTIGIDYAARRWSLSVGDLSFTDITFYTGSIATTLDRVYFGGLSGATDYVYLDNLKISSIPEPSTLAMLAGIALVGLGVVFRKR